ncbi:MAG: exonuclease domain-containing protein [Chitinophagales bacterium]
MNLTLKRPLAFFDLETTGVNVATDRIVEIGILIVQTDKTTEEHRFLVNPTIPIPIEASVIHGVYDKDVENEPTFAQLAEKLYNLLNPCDLAGYNSNRFDVPLLIEEFLRVNINFSIDDRNLLDAFSIFTMKEKRDLGSALKFYCNKEIVNAHTAMADVVATYDVFKAQIERYGDLGEDIETIYENTRNNKNAIDTAHRLTMIKGVPCFNFGKHKGQTVQSVLTANPGYYSWIMRSDFALHTKQKLKEVKLSLGL